MPDIRQAITLSPDETIAYFRAKGDHTQAHWDEAWQEEHARSFTVTKIMDLQLLGQVRASLDKVLSEGGTFEQWKKQLVPQLKMAGWYGRVDNPDLTGVDHAIFVGTRRLRTIYDTNLRMARAAGKWQRIQALKVKAPYLMYDAVNDRRTRPLHRIWGGLDNGKPIILPVDHPAWAIYFPPCGWGCRCGVIQLSERDLRRMNLRVSSDEELRSIGWMAADGTVGGGRAPWRRSNGQIVSVPAGIDPGFAYNPGAASLAGLAGHAADTLATAAAGNLRGARAVLDDLVDSPVLEHFLADPKAPFPVMLFDDTLRTALQSTTPVVVLPVEDAARQALRLTASLDLYRALPGLAERPTIVARDLAAEADYYLLAPRGDGWLLAIVRRIATGEMVLVDSRRIPPGAIEQLLSSLELLIDARS